MSPINIQLFQYLHESYLHTIDAPHVVDQIGLTVYDAGSNLNIIDINAQIDF